MCIRCVDTLGLLRFTIIVLMTDKDSLLESAQLYFLHFSLSICSRTTTYEDVLLVNWRWLERCDSAPCWPHSPRAQRPRRSTTTGSGGFSSGSERTLLGEKYYSTTVIGLPVRTELPPVWESRQLSWLKHFSDCRHFLFVSFHQLVIFFSCSGNLKVYDAYILTVAFFVNVL